MTQAFNFTPKAIQALRSHPCPGAPIMREANLWVADLLERAAVFVLPDCGELLDRSKPKPEVPGLVFKPPFPVVACEYLALNGRSEDSVYNAVPCSRRISLAWDWTGDAPSALKRVREIETVQPGVAVLSIFYVDKAQTWMCNGAAIHMPYDGQWIEAGEGGRSPFRESLIRTGAIPKASLNARGLESSIIPLMVEQLQQTVRIVGSPEAMFDIVRADGNDEAVAYADLCYALACRNVKVQRHEASAKLNRIRLRAGQMPLPDHHTLTLNGENYNAGGTGSFSGSTARRSHLRRGHIRRLGPDRITWVNQTIVGGSGGFASKDYRVKAVAR